MKDLKSSPFVKKGNKAANVKHAKLAQKIVMKEIKKNREIKNAFAKNNKPQEVKTTKFDILEDSDLLEGKTIKDLVQHQVDMQGPLQSMVQFLPAATRECYLEYFVGQKLRINYSDLDLSQNLNELLPMAFLSLKMWLRDNGASKSKEELLVFNSIGDFLNKDKKQKLLLNSDLLGKDLVS